VAVEDIAQVESISNLGDYLEFLQYDVIRVGEDYGLSVDPAEDLDLPEGVCAPIRSLRLLADYDKAFQIYFGELDKLGRTQIRPLIESIFRRYPQAEYLFILTNDFSEILFVSPQRITETIAEKPRIRLRILSIDRSNVYHTDSQVLDSIKLPQGMVDPVGIWKRHVEAFNVEKVTRQFFVDYKKVMDYLIEVIQKQEASKVQAKEFAQQLLNRLMLLYFLQRKGWLKMNGQPEYRYLRELWFSHRDQFKRGHNFYRDWLSVLYFNAFNGEGFKGIDELPDDVLSSFENMPYLNGGLFKRYKYDEKKYKVPDSVFELVFGSRQEPGLLERYNFTVREDTPLEVEVAVDPEMLGKVYESLVLEEEREGRRKAGIFYTPRTEVDFMCRQSAMEYLRHHTELDYDVLLSFLYEYDHPLERVNDKNVETIRQLLLDVKVVDPACGSGAFLVGMMHVLEELHNKLDDRLGPDREEMFKLRNEIVRRNLYGADIKSWAVRVAELRLWLALIVDAGEEIIKRAEGPVLPNLTFRLRIGDSLVQEVGGKPLAARALFRRPPRRVLELLRGLSNMKEQYYGEVGDHALEYRIRQRETDIFRHVINLRLGELEKKKRKLAAVQQKLTSTQTSIPGDEGELEKVRVEIRELDRLKVDIDKEREGRFFWEVDFAEVFGGGGFDIVIGNPPYVRQEKIVPLMETAGVSVSKSEYKKKLFDYSEAFWKNEIRYEGRSDLYVYFYYQAMNLLKESGILCLISSNSWLDVGFGGALQAFLLRSSQILGMFDNLSQRSFEEADVNTIITLAKRSKTREANACNMIRFVAFKVTWQDANRAEVLEKMYGERRRKKWIVPSGALEIGMESYEDDDFRVRYLTQQDLWLDGLTVRHEMRVEPFTGKYEMSKWGGKYLRAPDIFFVVLEKAKDYLVTLGDMGTVRYPIKTGINEFFYVAKHQIGSFGIEKEFLIPVVKTPKEFHSILLQREQPAVYLFSCMHSKSRLKELRKTGALSYIEWGEKQVTKSRQKTPAGVPWPQVPSVQGREFWYLIEGLETPDVICNRFFNQRFFFGICEEETVEDQTFYGLLFNDSYKPLSGLQAAILNSTLSYLTVEVLGRVGLGQGVLQYARYEMSRLLSFDGKKLPHETQKQLLVEFEPLSRRTIRSIFSEVSMKDRRRLDSTIFDVIGLTGEEREEVYQAVVDLVRRRLTKAESV
jgi:type I restriction-modification system DNA methylase subunit